MRNASEDVGKEKALSTADESVNWYSHCGNQYEGFFKMKSKLLYDSVIQLLAICTKNSIFFLEVLVHSCLLLCYSQKQRNGTSVAVPKQMNG